MASYLWLIPHYNVHNSKNKVLQKIQLVQRNNKYFDPMTSGMQDTHFESESPGFISRRYSYLIFYKRWFNKCWTGLILNRSGRGRIVVIPRHLSGRNEESYRTNQYGIWWPKRETNQQPTRIKTKPLPIQQPWQQLYFRVFPETFAMSTRLNNKNSDKIVLQFL